MRTKPLDYDARRDPKTERFCIRCQKDIPVDKEARYVRVIEGGCRILHPADEKLYTPDAGDCGWHRIGSECARKIGLQWSAKGA